MWRNSSSGVKGNKEVDTTKIVLDNKSIEQVTHFRYLGCDNTYDVDYDVDHKLAKFQTICDTVRRVVSRETRK